MDSVISSYLRTWKYDTDTGRRFWDASIIKGEYLSCINIAFARINSKDGYSLYIPDYQPEGEELVETSALINFWNEVNKLRVLHPHLKIYLSVGGWEADGFSDMADNPVLRAAFAADVMKWIEKYNLDGIDIDWEYPRGDENFTRAKVRPSDGKNFIILMNELRKSIDELKEKLKRFILLSTEIPASTRKHDINKVVDVVDVFRLTSYNYYGTWSKTTGHHNNIYNNPADPLRGGWSTDQALNAYIAAGIPPEKIMLGVAIYGWAFRGVAPGPNNDGLYQPFTSIPKYPPFKYGSIGYNDIEKLIESEPDYIRYWDDKAKSFYLYNGDVWITYTDQKQIKHLAEFAKQKKMYGIFVWEYMFDPDGEVLKLLIENLE